MGISQSIALNTSINLIGEVIGLKSETGAIVYGIYSFFNKLGNGIVLFVIMVLPLCTYYLYLNRIQLILTKRMNFSSGTLIGVVTTLSVFSAWILVMVGKAKGY